VQSWPLPSSASATLPPRSFAGPPARRVFAQGRNWDLEEIDRLERLGVAEAWIGEHFTAAWEPCPAPDLLIA
jgi:alkanesulfonate monooxygenase SsuD/methylene tetrahydromethanopterin reductase-like flavin-dependent oxidoreductase (luciferase family)